ncbi:MAG: hypothetical protein L3J98_10955 [Gammaproteobacteria bacterium]|nr:hypothetical protein [Gammaproteobacteria bacterium]MCF6260658.1 hypothetical protein [Gammaproteobacteria bacterium]
MITFRSILSSIVCISLPIVGIGIANAGGDIEKSFKGSTNNSAATLGAITIEHSSAEKNLTESFSLPSRLPVPGRHCDLSTRQAMTWDSRSPRWHDDDVNSKFADPNFPGYKLQSARLCIKYKDVDFTSHSAYTPELDVVQFGNTTIGILPGENGQTLTKCWNVKSRLQKNFGPNIPFIINIDAAHNIRYWALFLHQATLSTCHASITKPPYPIPLPLPINSTR